MSSSNWHALDEAGRERWRRERKHREYEALAGRPRLVTGSALPVLRSRLRAYRAQGMTLKQMQEQSGIHFSTISMHLAKEPAGMRRRAYEALVRVEFEEPSPTAQVDPTGTRRRLLSLWHDGFGPKFVGFELGCHKSQIQRIAHGRGRYAGTPGVTIEYGTHRAVKELYGKLETSVPADLGIGRREVKWLNTFAVKAGAFPRSCWDPDTIDDPQALPDWTGYCGTPWGWAVHKREGIPVCDRCAELHDPRDPYPGFDGGRFRVLRERAGLSRSRLGRQVGVDPSTIQYWEQGRSVPVRQGHLDRALSVLDATFEDVCDMGEDRHGP